MYCGSSARGRRGGNVARRRRLEAIDGEFEVYVRACSRCAAAVEARIFRTFDSWEMRLMPKLNTPLLRSVMKKRCSRRVK